MEGRVLNRGQTSNRADDVEIFRKRHAQFEAETMTCIRTLRQMSRLIEVNILNYAFLPYLCMYPEI